ncbi:kinesin motor domain-containing protein [Reticulomyxa filosa]|uniref:Kinesin motor domain-containing protein n=1 Tax=Reticulomyxa filosa TaxID=46433 RepID=X6PBJ7_RETFI|nr:kinesin motor domain-containing protein [Reticulomyxa filosa]|eukprot:ETO35424.1 kinesin motor domain-containing protein [Reticulomyxa filosa]
MLGDKNEPGIMVYTLRDLFHLANKNKTHYEITILITFMEIYNEEIRDLMQKDRNPVKLRESPSKVYHMCTYSVFFFEKDNVAKKKKKVKQDPKEKVFFFFFFFEEMILKKNDLNLYTI